MTCACAAGSNARYAAALRVLGVQRTCACLTWRQRAPRPACRTAKFIDSVKLPYIAPSLGGVESLIEQPTVVRWARRGACLACCAYGWRSCCFLRWARTRELGEGGRLGTKHPGAVALAQGPDGHQNHSGSALPLTRSPALFLSPRLRRAPAATGTRGRRSGRRWASRTTSSASPAALRAWRTSGQTLSRRSSASERAPGAPKCCRGLGCACSPEACFAWLWAAWCLPDECFA